MYRSSAYSVAQPSSLGQSPYRSTRSFRGYGGGVLPPPSGSYGQSPQMPGTPPTPTTPGFPGYGRGLSQSASGAAVTKPINPYLTPGAPQVNPPSPFELPSGAYPLPPVYAKIGHIPPSMQKQGWTVRQGGDGQFYMIPPPAPAPYAAIGVY